MTLKVAINGFGRIGRLVYRIASELPDIEIVAINSNADAATQAHLLQYDSTHGRFRHQVTSAEDHIMVNGRKTMIYRGLEPAALPWKQLGVDVVIESTGKYNDAATAKAHIEAGAKKVVLTAAGKNVDFTVVMGVNEEQYQPDSHHIISNASCTTNCLAPAAKVLNNKFGIVKGLMTTVHAFTNDQRILDRSHKDLRRARTATTSMIPTTTNAAKAVALVLPELKGKLNGFALRVPVQNVSVVDLTLELAQQVTVEEVNAALRAASENELKGIMAYSELPLVSCDYNGESNSGVVDALSTMVIGDNMVKVLLWYDNEWGYSCRVVDLIKYIGKSL